MVSTRTQPSHATSSSDPVSKNFSNMGGEQSSQSLDDDTYVPDDTENVEIVKELPALPWVWGFCAKGCGETFVRERVLHKGLGAVFVFVVLICIVGSFVLASDENRMQYVVGLSLAGAIVGFWWSSISAVRANNLDDKIESMDDKIESMEISLTRDIARAQRDLTYMRSDEYVTQLANRIQSEVYVNKLAKSLASELKNAEAAGASPGVV